MIRQAKEEFKTIVNSSENILKFWISDSNNSEIITETLSWYPSKKVSPNLDFEKEKLLLTFSTKIGKKLKRCSSLKIELSGTSVETTS